MSSVLFIGIGQIEAFTDGILEVSRPDMQRLSSGPYQRVITIHNLKHKY